MNAIQSIRWDGDYLVVGGVRTLKWLNVMDGAPDSHTVDGVDLDRRHRTSGIDWTSMLQRGSSGSRDPITLALSVCCMNVVQNLGVMVGTSRGQVQVWGDGRVHASVSAHEGACTVIVAHGGYVVTGGEDGKVCVWSAKSFLGDTQKKVLPRHSVDIQTPVICGAADMDRVWLRTMAGSLLTVKWAQLVTAAMNCSDESSPSTAAPDTGNTLREVV